MFVKIKKNKECKAPNINLSEVKRFVRELGGQYFGRDFHYYIYDDFLIISKLEEYPESPIGRLHVISVERIILDHLLNWINFERIIEEKSKELQRLYLLLETSEYATQAYNNIDTFSKQVLERLDYTLKMDGSLFYMWNKNAELPERVVFSGGFIQNFPEFKLHQLLEKIMESPEMYGTGNNYLYCKFESNSYQSGVVGLRRERGFDREELLFLKTVSNQLFHVVKLMKVIEDLEKAQANIKFLTEYDPLTMLYNRKSFEKLLKDEMERSDSSGEPLCMLLIDVDNFKVINDTYGYHVGDMVLKHVAEILRKRIRRLDTAGRLGGDEFGVILPKSNKTVVEYIADRLRQEVLNTPLIVGDMEVHASLSVGIVCYPVDAKSREEMLSLGEALMHAIKREGKGKVKMVEESVRELYTTFRRVEREILESFEKRSIEVFMQDIVNLSTERVEGFEALMRLRIKDELLPAGRFIHIAEEMGLVQKLDLVMVEEVFRRVSSYNNHKDVFIFLNLSPQDLTGEFIEDVIRKAGVYNVKAQNIVFEITEREAIQDIGKLSSFIKGMKEAGFKFAIDDFGSGYASFLYLKYMPVDFLKIEGEFIKSMKKSHADRTFVKSMVDVARGLGIRTIAEYVEDAETIDILLDLGVDYAQGYYIGKPGPAEEKLRSFFSIE
ncbi:MAG: bifunctional diguanylate cyclase/phosphodiesterase [Aquificaceae bacterium]